MKSCKKQKSSNNLKKQKLYVAFIELWKFFTPGLLKSTEKKFWEKDWRAQKYQEYNSDKKRFSNIPSNIKKFILIFILSNP